VSSLVLYFRRAVYKDCWFPSLRFRVCWDTVTPNPRSTVGGMGAISEWKGKVLTFCAFWLNFYENQDSYSYAGTCIHISKCRCTNRCDKTKQIAVFAQFSRALFTQELQISFWSLFTIDDWLEEEPSPWVSLISYSHEEHFKFSAFLHSEYPLGSELGKQDRGSDNYIFKLLFISANLGVTTSRDT